MLGQKLGKLFFFVLFSFSPLLETKVSGKTQPQQANSYPLEGSFLNEWAVYRPGFDFELLITGCKVKKMQVELLKICDQFNGEF